MLKTDEVAKKLREERQPLSDKCRSVLKGKPYTCSKGDIVNNVCKAYVFPEAKWRIGSCPLCDEVLRITTEAAEEKRVRAGQQKQKKKVRKK